MPIVFVHGVSVRLDRYEQLSSIVRRKFENLLPSKHFSSYFWGGHSVPLYWGGVSIPGVLERGADLQPQVIGTSVDLPDLQNLLLTDPWVELQSLQPEKPLRAGDRGYSDVQNRNDFFFDLKEDFKAVLEEHLTEKAGEKTWRQGLSAQHFVDAAVEIAITLIQQTGPRVDTQGMLQPLKRALTAVVCRCLPNSPLSEPSASWGQVYPEVEKAVNQTYSGAQGMGALFMHPMLSVATWALRSGYRTNVMPGVIRFLGDVLIYLQDRQTYLDGLEAVVVQAISDEKAKFGQNTPLWIVAHSLGGIIAYDYCCWTQNKREIERLATVGSQVGLFAEGDLLWEKFTPSEPTKRRPIASNIGSWISIYDLNDMLSFRAAPIFNGVTLEDVYTSGIPFPDSHSAYWEADEVYKKICR